MRDHKEGGVERQAPILDLPRLCDEEQIQNPTMFSVVLASTRVNSAIFSPAISTRI
jgi:hypothetical protein